MEWNSVPPDYAAKAIAVKAMARKSRSIENWCLLSGLLTAIGIGAGLLFFFPLFFDAGKNWIAPILMASGIGVGIVLRAVTPSTQMPRCPCCAQDWTIREGKTVPLSQQMLTWDRCPGCGAIMNDALLQIAVEKHARNNLARK